MGYGRLSCGLAAVAGLAVLGYASGDAQTGVKVKPGTVQVKPGALKGPLFAIGLRKSITALSPAEIAALRRGFAQMIAWNSAPPGSANFRRSLRYWANMHAYFGTGCRSVDGLTKAGMSGLSAQAKSNADENATWCTCQHGTDQFLTWHRMYLYYFEKVLQAAAGSSTLRLPYWDYESDGHVPEAYRSPTYVNADGQTVANPLYVANRQAQLNAGTGTLDPAVVDTSGAMPATSYLPFNEAIEGTPHGAVHCATGVANCPTGYMGAVPAAGNDPIFYSHHANIDRLYECWLKVNPTQRLPSGSLLTASFSFIDGAGNLVSRKVGDMLTTQQLAYSYTAGGGCPVRIPRLPPLVWRERPLRVVPILGPTPVERGTTALPVRIAPEVRAHVSANAAESAAQTARNASLVIDDLAFDQPPGVMFEVHLQDPSGKRARVGVINFFNRTAPEHDHGGGGGAATTDHRFDATAALRALGNAENAQLVLVPTDGVRSPRAPEAAEVAAAGANVRFAAARIELR